MTLRTHLYVKLILLTINFTAHFKFTFSVFFNCFLRPMFVQVQKLPLINLLDFFEQTFSKPKFYTIPILAEYNLDMSGTCLGHVLDMAKCPVTQWPESNVQTWFIFCKSLGRKMLPLPSYLSSSDV